MILPIVAYGHPVLRKICENIQPEYSHLQKLLSDMWETLHASNGVGLAAPQINKAVRLFLVDSEKIFKNMAEDNEENHYPDGPGIKQVFINARIKNIDGESWKYNEGCLSIPKIREDVSRHAVVTMEYWDEDFQHHQRTFRGITARIILHEYDHIEGKLFIDHISPLKRKLMKRKLNDISKGNIKVDYKMLFPG